MSVSARPDPAAPAPPRAAPPPGGATADLAPSLAPLLRLAARAARARAACVLCADGRFALATADGGVPDPELVARARARAARALADAAAGALDGAVPLGPVGQGAGVLLGVPEGAPAPDAHEALRDAAAAVWQALDLYGSAREAVAARERAETVLGSISDAFFTLDRGWRFAFVNDRAEQVLQRERASLLGRVLWDEFPAALGAVFEREYRRAMATGEPVAFDAYYPPPLDAWYEARAFPSAEGLTVYFQDVSEQRRALTALADSENRFRTVQDASTDGSLLARAVRDADGRVVDLQFTYANRAAHEILGMPRESVVGRTLGEAFPESVAEGRLEVYRDVIETGVPWEGEVRYARHAVRRGLRVTAVRVDDGVHLAFADLSERIRAAEERERLLQALQEERAVRDAVTAHMPAGLVVVEAPRGRLLLWNRETERLLGHPMLPAADVAEYAPYGGEHPDGRRYAPEEYPIARALRGEELDQYPLLYRRPDGSLARLSANAVPVRDAAGAVTLAVCTLTDVTAREQSGERTRRLQRISAALAAAVTPAQVTALVVADAVEMLGAFGGSMALLEPDGVHARFAHMIGYDGDEAMRWATFPVALPTPFGDAMRTRAVVALSGLDAWAARYPALVDSARTLGNVSLASLPLVAGDRVLGVVGLGFREARALTDEERRYLETLAGIAAQSLGRARAYEGERAARAEAEASRALSEQARRDAELANASKAQFLATMSHELRTPLNAIGGYAQLMEMGVHGPVTDAQLEALGRVQRSQQHLLGLINAVLHHARLEAGREEYVLADVPVLEVVRAVEALVAPQARAKGLRLEVHADAAALAVRADADKARQVLLNLLSNAIKFTAAGGRVTVSCTAGPDTVTIAVRDTGRGIAADALPRVFEPFVQVGRRLDSDDQGTGLGLAISRDLARGMGGDLTAESEPEVGSCFRFTLPAATGA